ncbi:MAG: AMP-binding protein [Pseudomonadota bacterium]
MAKTHPLVARQPNAPIAFLSKPSKHFGGIVGLVDAQTFISHVNAFVVALARNYLQDKQYAINLCKDRYLFLVSFCAVIKCKQTNLLAANKKKITQEQLSEQYEGSYLIHDGADVINAIPVFDASTWTLNSDAVNTSTDEQHWPHIEDEHLACISFTSGSTGQSKPNLKYWHTLHKSTQINGAFMLDGTDKTVFQVATMPPQHMWGLETSILLPLFDNVCMTDSQPLFPQDILDALETLPTPRLLVSTPVHLRALVADDTALPQLDNILCATSPLDPELAGSVETRFGCTLKEVYGCSEVGSMAVRKTATECSWRGFDGLTFDDKDDGTVVSAAHLPESIVLQDNIEFLDDGRFLLSGRVTDLIKVAGKRGSLLEINQILMRFNGLLDGVIFKPETENTTARLCAIVALKPNVDKASLIAFLREHLDDALVPRPVYVVDSLPRESNGKLLKNSLYSLLECLKV